MTEFFKQSLYSTEELPFVTLLSEQGVQLSYKYDNNKQHAVACLGVRGQMAEGGYQLQNIWHGGAADLAGLSAGDVIVAVDGLKVTAQLEKNLSTYAIGETVNIHFFRRDELMQLPIKLLASQPEQCTLIINNDYKAKVEKWILG